MNNIVPLIVVLSNTILFMSGYMWCRFLLYRNGKKRKTEPRGPVLITLESLKEWIFRVQGPTHFNYRCPIPGPFEMYPVLKPIDDQPGVWEIVLVNKHTSANVYSIGFHEDQIILDEIFAFFLLICCKASPTLTSDNVFGASMPN